MDHYGRIAKIPGWLSKVDHEIFGTILRMQEDASTPGAIVEIGTHHGKSLVSMLAAGDETAKAYVIDLFGRQEENRDDSGRGDLQRLKSNLAEFGISEDRVVIDARSSFEVTPDDIVAGVGRARLFHIDGGHHLAAVTNDLRLAIGVLEPNGVLAVDDVFRAAWPEVSMAVFGSSTLSEAGLRIFAIGFNKTYWCRSEEAEACRAALLADDFLRSSVRKTCLIDESPVLMFKRDPVPEWKLAWMLGYVLELRFPRGYWTCRRSIRRIRSIFRRNEG
jgi:predicted O-methyltransferase YrrM